VGSVNITGIYAQGSFLGKFRVVDQSTCSGFYGSNSRGTYRLDGDQLTFADGPLLGLAGIHGEGPSGPRMLLTGTSNGWETIHLDCQPST
jgi:hypothetical protein